MITIQTAVTSIIKTSPFLEEGLQKGLINYSAFARIYKNQLQDQLFKPVKSGAIVMSLQRISKSIKARKQMDHIFTHVPEISVRSNLFELTIKHTPSLSLMQQLGSLKSKPDNYFLTLTEGVLESTLIASVGLKAEIEAKIPQGLVVFKLDNLAAITMRLPQESLFTPGIFYFFLKQLAWDNINVVEMVSTTYENTFIVDEIDVDKAFTALKSLFKSTVI